MKGHRKTAVAIVIGVSLFLINSYAATDKNDEITIVIPRGALQGFINEVLPVEITKHERISGVLWLTSIENLRLELDKIWFTATIHGENIAYSGKIGGLTANLHFGAVDSILDCEALIRYDSEKGMLYIRPKALEQGKKGDVLWLLLVSLLSDREYPVEIQKLKPIAARFRNKTVEIDMDISNIYTTNDRLFIAVRPIVKGTRLDKLK